VIDLYSSCFLQSVDRCSEEGHLSHAAQAAKTAGDRPFAMSSHARETHAVARV